jgi:hypothetical protein
VDTLPEGYLSVGGGVAFVRDNPASIIMPISEDATAVELGDGRYLWKEGLQDGRPREMFVLVLPNGYTIEDPWPFLTGTKPFQDRIAVYWMLNFYGGEHVEVEWTLKPLIIDLDAEVISLNRRFVSRRSQTGAFFRVEDVEQHSHGTLDREPPARSEWAFIAMPMNQDDDSLVDVLEAIKSAAARCGIVAERIDEQQSNDRISDRMLDSIRRAKYIIADLTLARPNVFFEAGYGHGLGKTPIYVARQGTRIEFDVHDYPVLFYRNLKELRDKLAERLQAIGKAKPV